MPGGTSMPASTPLPINRMTGYLRDHENNQTVETAEDREAFWQDTLHLAMVELRAELKSDNPKVRSKAAHQIIDLERTKLRHANKSRQTGWFAGRASDGCCEDPSPARPAIEAPSSLESGLQPVLDG